ncbi:MAG: Mur ligase family protein, partial [Roseiflexaceae bacterium]
MITLNDLLAAGGQLHGTPRADTFADISYDSRLTRPGELFLALRTPHADGHDFISAALAAGATGVVCTWPPESADATIILADDPAALIQRWAARRLAAVAPLVVGVTGSVGKTSTVRAIATLLSQLEPAFHSRQSFNSLLGLPIALARLRDQDRYAVLELGTDRFGEIERLAALFAPHVAVVTNIGTAHLDAFGTPEVTAREKGALVAALPTDGWAVLYGDDPRVLAMRARTAARVLTFGISQGCALRASDVRYSLEGTRFRLHLNRDSGTECQVVEAFVPLIGEPAIMIGLAAVAAALACGLALEQAVQALALVEPIAGRLRPLPARGGATLLDDSVSAALPAILAALRTLAALPARRRIAVLGQPAATNVGAEVAHAQIGALAGQVADVLICEGDWGVAAIQAARQANPGVDASVVYTSSAALAALPSDLRPGDLVLIKGDAAARMERVAAGLLERPEHAASALVRQEPAWRSVRAGAPDRPTWLRIDLDAIGHNVRRLRAIAGVPLMVTLKA